jgi:hypothetical protein
MNSNLIRNSDSTNSAPSADEVEVDVKDHLPAPFLNIKEELVTCPGDARPGRHFFTGHDQFRNDPPVFVGKIVDASDMFPGNQEYVHRRLRIDVVECDDRFILI